MSVLVNFAMFPTDKGDSVSKYVSKVIEMIRESGTSYKLTPMATIIETETLPEALKLIEKAYDILGKESERVYSAITLDIQKNKSNRIESKVKSVEEKIGNVNK